MVEYVLVTGAAGSIGSHVVDKLLEQYQSVIGIDNFDPYYDLSTGKTINMKMKQSNIAHQVEHPLYEFHAIDLCNRRDLEDIFSKHLIGPIIHLAARPGVGHSFKDPESYVRNNVEATTTLFETAQRFDINQIVYASSSSVYGERSDEGPFKESDAIDNIQAPYGETKRSCELVAEEFHEKYGLKLAGLRFFTVYGERNRPDMAMYIFTEKIMNGEEIEVRGEPGAIVRDFTYIGDIADGVIAVAQHMESVSNQIFNIGCGRPVSVDKLVSLLEEEIGRPAKIQRVPLPKGDVSRTYADTSKIYGLCGWKPTTSLEEGVKKTVAWYKETH